MDKLRIGILGGADGRGSSKKWMQILNCIVNDQDPSSNGYGGLWVMRVLEVAYRFVETDEVVAMK